MSKIISWGRTEVDHPKPVYLQILFFSPPQRNYNFYSPIKRQELRLIICIMSLNFSFGGLFLYVRFFKTVHAWYSSLANFSNSMGMLFEIKQKNKLR